MTTKKFFYVLIGIIGLLAIAIILAAFGSSMLLEKQGQRLADAKVENRVVEEQQKFLVQAKEDLETYAELQQITKSIVPQDKDQAKTVREISIIAKESGIGLKTISFTASDLGGSSAPESGLTQVEPVEGISGVYSLEITITPDDSKPVAYYQFLDFLERLESNRRTAHVEKISLNPSESGSSFDFVLTLNAYVKP
jgi:hypothetical protein